MSSSSPPLPLSSTQFHPHTDPPLSSPFFFLSSMIQEPQSLSPPSSSPHPPSPPQPTTVSKRKKTSDSTQNPNSSSVTKKSRLQLASPLGRPLSSDGEIASAIHHLRFVDPALAQVIDSHSPPNFQSFQSPFHCLVRSILYQQLAFKAAASVYSRFLSLCGGETGVVPAAVLSLSPHQLRQIGVSPRKASYLHDLARKYHTGILSDETIVSMDDRSLFAMLTMVKGIGAWSVHMFMIFSLHRPDVLPVGDLGVRKGVQLLYGLDETPRPSQMEQLCDRWRPYRSVGAWYMWRLIENKAGPISTAVADVPVGGVGGSDAQFVDPIQMLPNIG